MSSLDDWKRKTAYKICGDSQVTRRLVCSFDSNYLLTPCGNNIQVYSGRTGELLKELVYHKDIVTDIVLDRNDKTQVYTSSLDGQIVLWNYLNSGLLKAIDIGRPILRFCIRPSGREPSLFVSIRSDKEVAVFAISSNIFTTDLEDAEHIPINAPPLITLGKIPNEITFTFDSMYLVTSEKRSLVLHNVDNEVTFKYSVKSAISSLACHPSQQCVATGTLGGDIFVWYNFGTNNNSNVIKTRLHWHSHAVADVCFSTDGTYLLSGGEEAVLVLWQLANEQKHFRPRLGAPIVGVACCPGDQTFAVSLNNNAIQLVSGMDNEVSHTLVQLYRGLPGLQKVGGVPTGLVHDPRTHCIVLNGCPGQLQFYDCESSSVKYQLEVVKQNVTSRSNKKPLTPTIVNHVAFNTSGLWLATSEEWDNGVLSVERKLKFWKFDASKQTYITHTSIDNPHQGKVTSLVFKRNTNDQNGVQAGDRFDSELVVTTSLDGYFKVWVCVEQDMNGGKRRLSWLCRSEGKYYNLSCYGCGFSEDGSLIALNYDKYITIWEPLGCEHRKTFNSPISGDHFKQVMFGSHNNSHLLFASSNQHLHIWNLLTCEGILTIPLTVNVIASDLYSDCVAIFTSSDLYLFSSNSSVPVHVLSDVHSVDSAIFIPTRECGKVISPQLYFINHKQLLFTLIQPEDEGQQMMEKRGVEDGSLDETRKIFNSIFGKTKGKTLSKELIKTTRIKPIKILDAPPHLLPPMSSVCKQFLLSILPGTDTSERSIDEDYSSDEEDIISNRDSDNDDTLELKEHVAMETSDPIEGDNDFTTKKEEIVEMKMNWLVGFFKREMVT